MRYGSGDLVYELVEGWPKLPPGWELGDVPSVAVDSRDRVWAFTRGEHPVVVFDREGNLLATWGKGLFKRPHGIFVGPGGTLYCVDDAAHVVHRCTPEGEILRTLGVPGQASDTGYRPGDFLSVKRAAPPFNRPTNVALSPEGDLYVTDGYGNARVHKFSPEGKLLFSWGEPGTGPGQFHLVHSVCVDRQGTVYVADRENGRVQLFTPLGEFITQWTDVYEPTDLYLDREDHLFVSEVGYRPGLLTSAPVPAPEDSHSRVTVRNLKGEVLAAITSADPGAPGGFLGPHGLEGDSHGDFYVAQILGSRARGLGRDPREFRSLKKYARVRG